MNVKNTRKISCGQLGRRERIRIRLVRSIAFQQELWREVYLRNEHLCKAREVLNKDNMTKLLTYFDSPPSARSKVRTNNNVERCNRVLRYLEKVRYKWRRRTIFRHILQQFANWIKRKGNKPAVAA